MKTVKLAACTFAALSQGLSACAVTVSGLVVERGGGVGLRTAEGQELRLIAVGDAAPVARLEGHLVRVEGRRVGRALTVRDWTVPEGLHGLTAWVGPLRWHGAQLAIDDRNTGAVYLLDEGATGPLGPHADRVVLVEGYVVGPNRVEVVSYRALE